MCGKTRVALGKQTGENVANMIPAESNANHENRQLELQFIILKLQYTNFESFNGRSSEAVDSLDPLARTESGKLEMDFREGSISLIEL